MTASAAAIVPTAAMSVLTRASPALPPLPSHPPTPLLPLHLSAPARLQQPTQTRAPTSGTLCSDFSTAKTAAGWTCSTSAIGALALAKCCRACLVGGVSAYAHAFFGRAMVSATRNDIALQPSRPSQKPAAISPVRRRVVAGKGEMSQGNASFDRYGGRAVLKLK